MEKSKEEIKLLPSNFTSHNFVLEVANAKIHCRIVKLHESLFLWMGSQDEPVMNDLSFALTSNFDKMPVATQILGPVADNSSSNMAKRLTRKVGKPVYISFNVTIDTRFLPAVEKSLQQELNNRPELLAF